MDEYKKMRTDALVSKIKGMAEELEHGRALNQIQLEILRGIIHSSRALDLSVNG